jgi:hypothetical protein
MPEAVRLCCPKCRTDIFVGARSCIQCGNSFDAPASSASSTQLTAARNPKRLIATVYSLTTRTSRPDPR